MYPSHSNLKHGRRITLSPVAIQMEDSMTQDKPRVEFKQTATGMEMHAIYPDGRVEVSPVPDTIAAEINPDAAVALDQSGPGAKDHRPPKT